MNLLLLQGAYFLYEQNKWIGCTPERQMQWWVFGFACLASTVLTFLNEASAGWEKWKSSVTETSRLQNAYQKSRLLILKRQINPHFLFNCFNTLSSLIQEDESEAENFLNELTRVYRYLLQGDEQQLVKLEEELKFIRSYLYLGKTRFGDALRVEMHVEEADLLLKMAPLTLQVVLENIIYSNAFSKADPLFIRIGGNGRRGLVIGNTEQPKKVTGISEHEEALDDLVRKYRLLSGREIEIRETGNNREIIIPLIESETLVV
jgi:LytS/YehU family sensor histidine kinase